MGALALGFALAPGRWRGAGTSPPAFDFGGGVLPAGATLNRAGPGRYVTAARGIAAAAADVARFDHDPAGGMARGLLIEPGATNLTVGSEALDNASWWTVQNGAIAANAGTAPDGSAAADLFTINTAGGGHAVSGAGGLITVAAGTVYAVSAFARAVNGGRYVRFNLGANGFTTGTPPRRLCLDTTNGQVVAEPGLVHAIDALANGWFRIAVIATATDASANAFLSVGLNQNLVSTGEIWTGDGTAGVLIWGAQFEAGGQPSSYIPTTTAAAARAADTLTLDWGSRGVADGAHTIRYTFDDGSVQDVAATISGGTAVLPGNLNRRWLKRAEKL